MQARRTGRAGFTLIELLVVMAIIATLLSIAAPRYFDHLDRARETSLRQTLAVMRDAIDKFKGDTGQYPRELAELADKRYLRRVPADPITDSAETWVVLAPQADPAAEEPESGVWDVRSGAEGVGRDGTSYADW